MQNARCKYLEYFARALRALWRDGWRSKGARKVGYLD